MNPPKRIKPNPTSLPCLKNFVIPDTDFTLETIMSLSLLSFIYPITESSQIQFLDPLTDIPYQKLTDPNTFVIGIGGKYIPNCQVFHWKDQTRTQKQKQKQKQKGKGKRKNEQNSSIDQYFNDSKRCKLAPLSAVGLIYKLYGKLIICNVTKMSINDDSLNWLFERCYFDYIEIIDAYTRNIKLYNGILINPPKFNGENLLLPSIIKFYNIPVNNNQNSQLRIDKIFETISILKLGFSNFLKYFAFSFIKGKQIIIDTYGKPIPNIDPKLSDQIIILSEFIPWKEHLFNYEKDNNKLGMVKYVIFKDTSNSWRIACVPINPSSFESRKKLPLSWRGLEIDELKQVSEVQDIVFVHANGFIGGAESLDGCLKMAIKSLLNVDVVE